MTINLPCFGIVIDLGPEDPDRPRAYQGGKITSTVKGGNRLYQAAIDAIESLVLAPRVCRCGCCFTGLCRGDRDGGRSLLQ